MNAIEFLIKEHDRVRKTFADISKPSHRFETRKDMFEALCEDLLIHETMEQKVWYPNFKDNERLDETVSHLIKEEKTAEKSIEEFGKVKTEQEWEAKFNKFRNDVENHAAEEETKLFPNVAKLLDEKQLERIGNEMHQFKTELASKI